MAIIGMTPWVEESLYRKSYSYTQIGSIFYRYSLSRLDASPFPSTLSLRRHGEFRVTIARPPRAWRRGPAPCARRK